MPRPSHSQVLLLGCIVLLALYGGSYVALRQENVLTEIRHYSPWDNRETSSIECCYSLPGLAPADERWLDRGSTCLSWLYQPLAWVEVRGLRGRPFLPR